MKLAIAVDASGTPTLKTTFGGPAGGGHGGKVSLGFREGEPVPLPRGAGVLVGTVSSRVHETARTVTVPGMALWSP